MCSLFALWIYTFLQNFITLCCLVFELRDLKEKEKEEEEEEKKYRLDAEARCLREHCNPSGPVECGVPSAARALPTGPEGAMSRRY